MSRNARVRPFSAQARARLHEGLQARREEIEEAIATRIYAIADPVEVGNPAYVESLRATLGAALDYGLATIGSGEEHAPQIPPALLSQARTAARNGVSLDTVLRRYFAGYSLLGYFLIEEAARDASMGDAELQRLVAAQAGLFDRLLAAVSEEHRREAESSPGSAAQRRAVLVRRLLDGELLDSSELAYDLSAHHIGMHARGAGAAGMLRALAAALDRRLLLVEQDDSSAWAWLGAPLAANPEEIGRAFDSLRRDGVTLALGEPGDGPGGWRLTHRQAAAALPVALCSRIPLVRYADVAILASVLKDDLAKTSLHRLYLAPLEGGRDDGVSLWEALSAYFAADRNVSSAAAALGASRNTVAGRLAAVEQKLGRPLASCASDLEVALSLKRLEKAGLPAS